MNVIHRNHTKKKLFVLLILAFGLLLIAIFADYLCPYDPYEQNLNLAKQPPSASHLLGTDMLGRDLLSRIIIGSRSSIFSVLLLIGIVSVFGTCFGILCGWQGGPFDSIAMRISDLFLAFPGLVFAMAVAGVLGGGLHNAVIALAAISWPKYALLARGQTLAQRDLPYLAAARLAGCNHWQLIFRHILPNILGPVFVTATLDIGTMLMELAGLSYLGLGAKVPMAEWGSMMSNGRSMLQTAPWIILGPGGAIFISVVIFNLLGDTLRDYLDPRQRGQI